MTFAVAAPIATQVVIAVFDMERLVSRQRYQNGPQITVECRSVLAFGLALVIAFKSRGAVNRPHSGLPSDHPH